MSEVPKHQSTNADRTTSEVSNPQPSDAGGAKRVRKPEYGGRAKREVQQHQPTDANRAKRVRKAEYGGRVMSEVQQHQPSDADGALSELPKQQRTDAERAISEVQQHQPTDADRITREVPKHQPTGADRPMSEVLKHQPTDADRATSGVPPYEPTDAERATLNRQAQRQKEQPVAPSLKVVADYRGVRVEYDHPDQVVAFSLLKEALGTANDHFCLGLLGQMYEFVGLEDSPRVEIELNLLLSTIINGKPKDEHHALLLYQLGVTSVVQNRIIQKTNRIESEFSAIERDLRDKTFSRMINERNYSLIENLSRLMDSTERTFSRLARTYCTLLETSDRHRRNGEPSTTVHVAPGGQAIVGNITQSVPQTAPNNPTAGTRALTDQQQSAMPIIGEPDRVPVPVRRRKKSNGHQQPSA
jgi:hypothetical protein